MVFDEQFTLYTIEILSSLYQSSGQLFFFFSSSVHTPGAYSLDASGALGLSEKTFLNAKKHGLENEVETSTVPSLDDFDKELEIFRVS